MNKKGKIKGIICPFCFKEMFQKNLDLSNSFMGGYRFNFKSEPKHTTSTWRCHNCVYLFRDKWLNEFYQYEPLVLREGEDKGEWIRNLKDD
ncbi:MAG: hypothetical protein ACP5D2_02105 [Candidatus Nanoarchaeia archaeon]